MKKTTSFLLGAGASRAVGKPSTQDITDEILSEDGISNTKRRLWFSDGKGNHTLVEKNYPKQLLEYLKKLKDIAESYNTNLCYKNINDEVKRHAVNYEDVFYMLTQIHEHIVGDCNPYGAMLHELVAYKSLVNELLDEATERKYSQEEFTIHAVMYINETVLRMLKGDIQDFTVLEKALNTLINNSQTKTNVFTLNHDTVFEQYLYKNHIKYADGFGGVDGEIRKWNPDLFDGESDCRVRLLKLHGSIDWRGFDAKDKSHVIYGIYVGNKNIDYEYSEIYDKEGTCYVLPRNREILIGTDNKIKSYLGLHYWEMYSRFRQYLKQTDKLVVMGYSFGDHGINGQLLEWLLNDKGKRMIVVDVNDKFNFLEELPAQLRHTYRWIDLLENGKVSYYSEGIKGFDFENIIE